MSLSNLAGGSNTGTGTTAITLTPGFQVKCGILFTVGLTGTTNAVSSTQPTHCSVGLFDANTQHSSCFSQVDNATTSEQMNAATNRCLTEVNVSGGALVGELAVTSITSTQITFTPQAAFSADYRFAYLFLGGAAIEASAIVSVTEPLNAGLPTTSAITGLSFQPNCMLVIPRVATGFPQIGFGIAAPNLAQNAIANAWAGSKSVAGTLRLVGREGHSFIAGGGGANVSGRGYVSAWTSDGATITWDEATGGITYSVLALKIAGGAVGLESFTTFQNTSSENTHNTAFVPKAGISIAAGDAQTSDDSSNGHFGLSVGFFDDALHMHGQGVGIVNSNPQVYEEFRSDAFVVPISWGDNTGIRMGVSSLTASQVKTKQLTSDTRTSWGAAVFFGESASDNEPGAGACSIGLTCAAVGRALQPAVGGSALSLTPAAAGAARSTGVGATSVAFALAGAGASKSQGQGAASVSVSASAVGSTTCTGAGTATCAFSAAGVSSARAAGLGAIPVAFTAVAASLSGGAGAGSCSFGLSAAGVGACQSRGAGAASVAVTPAAVSSSLAKSAGATSVAFTAVAFNGDGAVQGAGAIAFSCTAVGVGRYLALVEHDALPDIEFDVEEPLLPDFDWN